MIDIINLDKCVLNALEFFSKTKLPKPKVSFNKPLIIGSGNAEITGRIIFSNKDAIFANESNYLEKLKNIKSIDGAVIISASGGKHAPIIAKELKKHKIQTLLFTNTKNSLASKLVDQTFVFPKNSEPYTYNTSTYLGMILSQTKENPKKILSFIKKIKVPKISKYTSYFIIVPEEFEEIKYMFQTKFDELFGPKIQARIFTYEQAKHAKTIIHDKNELFLGIGVKNNFFGKNKLNFSLPKNSSYASILAVGYYIIGKIQKQNPQYFKDNIEKYVKEVSKIFGQEIKVIN